MKRAHILAAHALIVASSIMHATVARATEAAYLGAVAANWCHYLGPDCKPYGLSARGRDVFVYLTQGKSAPGIIKLRGSREISYTMGQVSRGDPKACNEVQDIVKAMRQSPSPDIRQQAQELSVLADTHCH